MSSTSNEKSQTAALSSSGSTAWENRRLSAILIFMALTILTVTVAVVIESVRGLGGWLVAVAALAAAWLVPVLVIVLRAPVKISAPSKSHPAQ